MILRDYELIRVHNNLLLAYLADSRGEGLGIEGENLGGVRDELFVARLDRDMQTAIREGGREYVLAQVQVHVGIQERGLGGDILHHVHESVVRPKDHGQ